MAARSQNAVRTHVGILDVKVRVDTKNNRKLRIKTKAVCEEASLEESPPLHDAAVRAELAALKMSGLIRRAQEVGIDQKALDDATDGDAPKPSLIELIIAKHDVPGGDSAQEMRWAGFEEDLPETGPI